MPLTTNPSTNPTVTPHIAPQTATATAQLRDDIAEIFHKLNALALNYMMSKHWKEYKKNPEKFRQIIRYRTWVMGKVLEKLDHVDAFEARGGKLGRVEELEKRVGEFEIRDEGQACTSGTSMMARRGSDAALSDGGEEVESPVEGEDLECRERYEFDLKKLRVDERKMGDLGMEKERLETRREMMREHSELGCLLQSKWMEFGATGFVVWKEEKVVEGKAKAEE